ncbi:MAG: N-acetylmuramoyl-L-alanine amidase [Anaerolineae bacterium]|nr:N-acetylmuramoyl-L-alanine amidase [Anaerolineae bacterium]
MRERIVHSARLFLILVIVLAFVVVIVAALQTPSPGGGSTALAQLLGSLLPRVEKRIGIVAGHSGSDSGAVCPDGLTEAQVNRTIAEAVVKELTQRGARVDLLDEFDNRLRAYRADAFVSIHADSCQVNLSGFKVASLEGGSDASARLADCLWREYELATNLPRHPTPFARSPSRPPQRSSKPAS